MFRYALLLVPALLMAGEPRYARLGEMEGRPEVEMPAAGGWQPALRNMPLVDGVWIRTPAGSRVEIELDEGSAFRMDGDSLCELSDYTRLSTGQRVTLISLDHGVAYFTGEAQGRDSLVLALPGAQATIRRGARVRLEARDTWSQIVALEGSFVFSSPAAELEIKEGFTVRTDSANTARFYLFKEIPALASDGWSEARDKALAVDGGAQAAGFYSGGPDLDANGTWIETAANGTVWKPKSVAGWAPFRSGKWLWYDGLGYTWVGAEPWGWLPYHYGRWMLDESAGWVWVPGKAPVFSPGDVYWLRGAKLAAWGPLAPGENWDGKARPRYYLMANTTFAPFAQDAPEIDPAGYVPPKQSPAMAFVPAPPSPALNAARLEVHRPVLRAGSTRVVPHLDGVSYEQAAPSPPEVAAQAPAAEEPPPPANTTVIQPPAPPPVVVVTPPPPPPEVYYPAPVYTGIVVVNPPERHHDGGRPPHRQNPPADNGFQKPPGTPHQPPPIRRPEPPPRIPVPPPATVRRVEPPRAAPAAAPSPKAAPPADKTGPARAVEPPKRAREESNGQRPVAQ